MKKFLILSGIFLLGAIIAVVAVYAMITYYLSSGMSQQPQSSATDVTNEAPTNGTTTLDSVPENGIPFSSVKLSDQQKTVVNTLGINPDSFVITKEMLACAIEKIGQERVTDITTGSAPTVVETAKLVPCLK